MRLSMVPALFRSRYRCWYYDNGTDSWELQYDATGDNFKSAGIVQKTNSREWLETTFELPDAQFAGELSGYDFRLRSRGDGNEYCQLRGGVAAGNEGKDGKESGDAHATVTTPVSLSPARPVTLSFAPANDDFDAAAVIRRLSL